MNELRFLVAINFILLIGSLLIWFDTRRRELSAGRLLREVAAQLNEDRIARDHVRQMLDRAQTLHNMAQAILAEAPDA